MYETVEANQVAHRASGEYKAFRKAVADESLLESPSDLRFWRPTGIGFLTRDEPISFRVGGSDQHVVIDQFTPSTGDKTDILALMRRIASAAAEDQHVSSFWVLDRGADEDDGVYVFACYKSKEAWSTFEAGQVSELWAEARSLNQGDWLRTSWKASGIGFIGR